MTATDRLTPHGQDPLRPCYDVKPNELVAPPPWSFKDTAFQARWERACLATFGSHCLHLGDRARYFCCTCGAGTDLRRIDSLIWNRLPPADVPRTLLYELAEDRRRQATKEDRREALRAIAKGLAVPDHVVGLPSPWWRRRWQRLTRRPEDPR